MSLNKIRMKFVQNQMEKQNISCLIIPLGTNFRWLFGFLGEQSDRFIVAILKKDSSPILLAPEYELSSLTKSLGISDCIGWKEKDNPIEKLTESISDIDGTFAIEPTMWFSDYNRINEYLPKKKFISAETVFNTLRSVKDEEEQKLLLKASQRTAEAILSTLNELEVGITEREVMYILKHNLNCEFEGKFYIEVTFGENTAILPSLNQNRKLMKQDVVVIDAGVTCNDYWGDITLTSVFGKATENFKEIYKIVKTANTLAKQAVLENKRAHEIDKAARVYITKMGYGKFFTHRTGHGLGLEIHEEPYIVENNINQVIKGNAFTIEPGIYLPGKFGVRIEDDIIKTEDDIKTINIPRDDVLEI